MVYDKKYQRDNEQIFQLKRDRTEVKVTNRFCYNLLILQMCQERCL